MVLHTEIHKILTRQHVKLKQTLPVAIVHEQVGSKHGFSTVVHIHVSGLVRKLSDISYFIDLLGKNDRGG